MSLISEYEQLKNDFYEESNKIINDIIGERFTEIQKEELISSLIPILRKYFLECCNYIENTDEINFSVGNQANLPKSAPFINLFLISSPTNTFYSPYYGNTQQPMYQMIPQAPYYPNYNSSQLFGQQIQPLQQPNYIYFNQQAIINPKPSKKKSKNEKKSHDKKSHQKQKKSEKKSKKSKNSDKKGYEIQSFPQSTGSQFNGIINYLTSKTGGNIHRNGTIKLTCDNKSSLSTSSEQPPESVLDLNTNNWFGAKSGSKDYWLCFDFKERKVEISSYTIQSYSFKSGHLKNWVLETSENSEEWKIIDQHSSDQSLNGGSRVSSFTTSKNDFSRFVRIRQTGEFWRYESFVTPGFAKIEFYGRLKSPK